MKKTLLTLLVLFMTASYSFAATNSYDRYGSKTGSYKQSGSTINHYDKYGSKTGSFKKDSSGRITEYDKYGRKVGSYY